MKKWLQQLISKMEESRQRKAADLQQRGLCPECAGTGSPMLSMYDYAGYVAHPCPGCDGSGIYKDWDQ